MSNAGHLAPRGQLALGEQLGGARVAREVGDVPEPDERLDEAVEDVQLRPERVLRVVHALPVRGRDAHARRRRLLEQLEPRLDARQQLRHAAELDGGARDRLQARALGQPADPRRLAAVEREVVLPREPAAARHGDREQLVEQHRVARVVALAALGVGVELAEVGERVELEPLARDVLPDELGALEGDALAARRAAAAADHHSALRCSVRKSGKSRPARSCPRRAMSRPRSPARP